MPILLQTSNYFALNSSGVGHLWGKDPKYGECPRRARKSTQPSLPHNVTSIHMESVQLCVYFDCRKWCAVESSVMALWIMNGSINIVWRRKQQRGSKAQDPKPPNASSRGSSNYNQTGQMKMMIVLRK